MCAGALATARGSSRARELACELAREKKAHAYLCAGAALEPQRAVATERGSWCVS
jgi:hypothetical protein